eukprot:ANDGO_04532.mRNA.1 Ribosomal RNA-processing protein 1 homolog
MADDIETREKGLIRRLADSTPSIRNRALKNLKRFMAKRPEFTETEMLKLWRGLFFAMFHADKAHSQLELAQEFANIIDVLQTKEAKELYVLGFYSTMSSMWSRIDRHRLDKFMSLVRIFTSAAFERELFEEAVSRIRDPATPVGLIFHLIDVWPLEHCTSVDSVRPFVHVLESSADKAVRKRVSESVFAPLVKQWDRADLLECVRKEAMDLGGRAETLDPNRKSLYALAQSIEQRLFAVQASKKTFASSFASGEAVDPQGKLEERKSVRKIPAVVVGSKGAQTHATPKDVEEEVGDEEEEGEWEREGEGDNISMKTNRRATKSPKNAVFVPVKRKQQQKGRQEQEREENRDEKDDENRQKIGKQSKRLQRTSKKKIDVAEEIMADDDDDDDVHGGKVPVASRSNGSKKKPTAVDEDARPSKRRKTK